MGRRACEVLATGVITIKDERYDDRHPDARLDVYVPMSLPPHARLPALVWIHGGAFVSGRKDDAAAYFTKLAAAGFVVVSVEYARAPRARYPTAVRQVNQAVAYVLRDPSGADRFRADCTRVFLGGDSAGAQIASQLAALVTNPEYAAEVGIGPWLRPDQLRGTVLFGGVYDAGAVLRADGIWQSARQRVFVEAVLWAYTGARRRRSSALRQMSTIDHVTSDFPPTFVCGGNADPFTPVHSEPFAARLTALGVDVAPQFFAPGHEPALPHQFQFDLDVHESCVVFDALVEFMRRRSA